MTAACRFGPVPLAALVCALHMGCASIDAEPSSPRETEQFGTQGSALEATDPVSKAIATSCSTTSVRGLAEQLVDELECLRPGTMSAIATMPNLTLDPSVIPYLQTAAASSLGTVAAARAAPLRVNSAIRALPQQYLLYSWYTAGRCGIALASRPGQSNHESGLAIDIGDHAGWLPTLEAHGWRWFGAADPVHFDLIDGGTDIRALSVQAFERLWNRNHPEDPITENGTYDLATEARLARAPVGGFRTGALCGDASAPAPEDGGLDDAPADAPRPVDADASQAVSPAPPGLADAADSAAMPSTAAGCALAATAEAPPIHGETGWGWAALSAAIAVSCRGRRRSQPAAIKCRISAATRS